MKNEIQEVSCRYVNHPYSSNILNVNERCSDQCIFGKSLKYIKI